MDKEAIRIRYGIDPESVGYDNRGFDIVEEIGPEEMEAGAQIGDLCVYTRDGTIYPVDEDAVKKPNFRGMKRNTLDERFLNYYFAPLPVDR